MKNLDRSGNNFQNFETAPLYFFSKFETASFCLEINSDQHFFTLEINSGLKIIPNIKNFPRNFEAETLLIISNTNIRFGLKSLIFDRFKTFAIS